MLLGGLMQLSDVAPASTGRLRGGLNRGVVVLPASASVLSRKSDNSVPPCMFPVLLQLPHLHCSPEQASLTWAPQEDHLGLQQPLVFSFSFLFFFLIFYLFIYLFIWGGERNIDVQ